MRTFPVATQMGSNWNRKPAMVLISLVLAFLFFSSCSKPKTVSPTPPPAVKTEVPLEPEIKLSVQPALIRSGESATLQWEAKNADIVTIDGGIGNVSLQGTRKISPAASTVYTATAQGAGKTATSNIELKVLPKPSPAPTTEEEKEGHVTIEELFASKIKDVFFEYDKYDLSQEAVDILYANATFLREHADLNFIIGGHCDERGTAEYNLALGERRAKVVRDFLANLGIEPRRITSISYGEEKPFSPGVTEEAYVQNRRAHFALNPR